MKRSLVLLAGLFFVGSMVISCRKNYDCVLPDGTVVFTCNSCRSNGVAKAAFDTSCSLEGGSVQVQ